MPGEVVALSMPGLVAILVDVGGTLWSERQVVASREQLEAERMKRLQAAGVSPEQTAVLYSELATRLRGADALEYLDILSTVEQACVATRVSGVSAEAIRHAMCVPATMLAELFSGARVLLQSIRDRGLRCVLASNGIWRNEADYWDDFRALDLGDLIDAVVSSVDTLWRKPHRRFYKAALQAAAAPAAQCLVVGNSEAKDIVPAADLGMLTVRVAIEEDRPSFSQADVICDSLEQVAAVLRETELRR